MGATKIYCDVIIKGCSRRVVAPLHFYSAPSQRPQQGLGLYCQVDLAPGDVWWAECLGDARWVTRVVPWVEFQQLSQEEQDRLKSLCYVDAHIRAVVECAEPFGRVNHAGRNANSATDDDGNSVALQAIPAGTEITIPYAYDAVVSVLWKFPHFKSYLAQDTDEESLLVPVRDHLVAQHFLALLE